MSDLQIETVSDFQVEAMGDSQVKCICISELNPYPEYKDSGVEWIGRIPEGWKLKKLKRLTRQIVDGTHFTPTYVNEGIPFLRVTDIQNKEINLESVKRIPKNEHIELTKRCRPERGDLLLSKNGTIGVPCVVTWDWEFSIFVSLCLIKFKQEIDVNYSKYFLLSDQIDEQITMGEKKNTVTNLHLDKIKEFLLIVPPLPEQQAIVNFLDRETSRIDTLIEKKQRFIELLEEKRATLISHRVTKGLDPDVPMKNSGTEWIGEIPEHWDVIKIKKIVSIPITDGPHETPNILDEGIPFISAEAIRNNKIDFSRKRGCISTADHLKYCSKYKPLKDDIYLIKSGATTGNVAIVETEKEFSIWSPLAAIRVNKKIASPRFVLNFLNSNEFQTSVQLSWNFGTQQNIGMSIIENLSITFPTLQEQQSIASYLDSETAQINTLIEKIKQSIEYLKEYRAALISDAVTGKIDVRGTACE